jgi:hypothetical protein
MSFLKLDGFPNFRQTIRAYLQYLQFLSSFNTRFDFHNSAWTDENSLEDQIKDPATGNEKMHVKEMIAGLPSRLYIVLVSKSI